MQALPQIAPPVRPARPGCLVWYAGDPCDLQIQQFHQVLEDQQRQEWQSSVTARFERQIADQQKQINEQQAQIRTLQTRIDSQTMETLRSEARSQAFVDGIGVIIGIGLAFLLVVAAFRKLSHHTPTDSDQSHATSAQSGW
jgi:uncharacterized protein YlxW (UPF0749 family)